MSIYDKLSSIQEELNVPKGQYNEYGGFNYRSCEDILTAVKPLCRKYKTTLILTDELMNIGARYYVKATAKLIDLEVELNSGFAYIAVSAFAREEEGKKGMDGSQVTGASSSYARKYALNGLFNIDDVKDSDFTNTAQKEPQRTQTAPQRTQTAPQAKPSTAPKARQTAPTSEPDPDLICDSCGAKITEKVKAFSIRKYGIPLCMDCQDGYAR